MLLLSCEQPLAIPHARALTIFEGEEEQWLPAPARYISDATWNTYVGTARVGVHVLCQVTLPRRERDRSWRKLAWRPDAGVVGALSPRFEGRLGVGGSDGSASLVLEGHYAPPIGLIGRLGAWLGMRRVAARTAERFVADVAAHMEAIAATPAALARSGA